MRSFLTSKSIRDDNFKTILTSKMVMFWMSPWSRSSRFRSFPFSKFPYSKLRAPTNKIHASFCDDIILQWIITFFRGIFELTPHSIFENSSKHEWSSSNRTFDIISASSFLALRILISQTSKTTSDLDIKNKVQSNSVITITVKTNSRL